MSGADRIEEALRFYEEKLAAPAGPSARIQPFKFLDAYQKEDRDLFFGRDDETEDLRSKYYRSNLLVVYGESGSGKTSLIQCGLQNAVPVEDAEFFVCRLNVDPLEALVRQTRGPDCTGTEDLAELVRCRSERSSKTVVLVLDQFEELFLLHGPEVRERVVEALARTVEGRTDVKIIFIVREEYFARMTEVERLIPNVLANRYWLRKMNVHEAREVIEEPCRKFGIALEGDAAGAVLERLKDAKGEIDLPYLQILLDRLYRNAVARGEPLRFEARDPAAVGEMGDILVDFLESRVAAMEEPLLVRDLLKLFVTAEGTKKPVHLNDVVDVAASRWPEQTKNDMNRLLTALVEARILRQESSDAPYELRHDALAHGIARWFSPDEEELLGMQGYVDERFQDWRRSGTIIDDGQALNRIERMLPQIKAPDGIHELLAQSRRAKRTSRVRGLVIGIVVPVVLLLAVVAAVWQAVENRRRAEAAEATVKSLDNELACAKTTVKIAESYADGKWEEGAQAMEALLRRGAEGEDVSRTLLSEARWFLEFGRPADALNVLAQNEHLLRGDSTFHRLFARSAFLNGQMDLADKHATTAATQTVGPCTLLQLSLTSLGSGRFDDAFKYLNRALEMSDDEACTRRAMQDLRGNAGSALNQNAVRLYVALLHADLGHVEEARAGLEAFLAAPDQALDASCYEVAKKRLSEIPVSGRENTGSLQAVTIPPNPY